MIICHCKVVNDRMVAEAVESGARTVSQVCRATGAGRDCGSCVFALKNLVCHDEPNAQSSYLEVEGAAS